MNTPVEIVGAGVAEADGGRPSHAELLYRATRAALDDAGLERDDITTAVTSSYDFVEGRPLSNQFTLDSIGGTMKPCDLRVGDDGMHAVAAGAIAALADPGAVVVVGAVQLREGDHSEETYRRVQELSYEPVWQRPILNGARNPEALSFGMRAQLYMAQHGTSEDDLANLVSRRSSGGNGSRRSVDEILESEVIAGPLRELHVAPPTDVAAVLLLSTDPPGRSQPGDDRRGRMVRARRRPSFARPRRRRGDRACGPRRLRAGGRRGPGRGGRPGRGLRRATGSTSCRRWRPWGSLRPAARSRR